MMRGRLIEHNFESVFQTRSFPFCLLSNDDLLLYWAMPVGACCNGWNSQSDQMDGIKIIHNEP